MLNQDIERVVDPTYLDGIDEATLDEIRARHDECVALENRVSYARRLAQGRIDIVVAELDRRATGGSVQELLDSLPSILAGQEGRASGAQTRVPSQMMPEELGLDDVSYRLVTDDTLAQLPDRDEGELAQRLEDLRAFERAISDQRRALHDVLDRVERVLAARLAVEA